MRGLPHQIEVVLDQPAVGRLTFPPLRGKEAPFLVVGETWIASYLGAVTIFVIIRRPR